MTIIYNDSPSIFCYIVSCITLLLTHVTGSYVTDVPDNLKVALWLVKRYLKIISMKNVGVIHT